jgi:hypothetical protein
VTLNKQQINKVQILSIFHGKPVFYLSGHFTCIHFTYVPRPQKFHLHHVYYICFAYRPFHLPFPSSNTVSSIPFHLYYMGQSCILAFCIRHFFLAFFVKPILYWTKLHPCILYRAKLNACILSACLKAVICKVCLLIWMVMFHIFARTLKDEGKLRHKLIFCAFTFHWGRLVLYLGFIISLG